MNFANLSVQQKMRKVLQSYRDSAPVKTISKNEAAAIDLRIGHIQDNPVKRLVIHFRSNGCGWKNAAGGCIMCGFWNETTQMKDKIKTRSKRALRGSLGLRRALADPRNDMVGLMAQAPE
jgi:uncharacterized Fe-S cluster-containing MiaB family protein